MMRENVKDFYKYLRENEDVKKELEDNLKRYTFSDMKAEDQEAIILSETEKIAKKYNFNVTKNDLADYLKEAGKEMTEEDLLNVAGGFSTAGVAMGFLLLTGISIGSGAAVNIVRSRDAALSSGSDAAIVQMDKNYKDTDADETVDVENAAEASSENEKLSNDNLMQGDTERESEQLSTQMDEGRIVKTNVAKPSLWQRFGNFFKNFFGIKNNNALPQEEVKVDKEVEKEDMKTEGEGQKMRQAPGEEKKEGEEEEEKGEEKKEEKEEKENKDDKGGPNNEDKKDGEEKEQKEDKEEEKKEEEKNENDKKNEEKEDKEQNNDNKDGNKNEQEKQELIKKIKERIDGINSVIEGLNADGDESTKDIIEENISRLRTDEMPNGYKLQINEATGDVIINTDGGDETVGKINIGGFKQGLQEKEKQKRQEEEEKRERLEKEKQELKTKWKEKIKTINEKINELKDDEDLQDLQVGIVGIDAEIDIFKRKLQDGQNNYVLKMDEKGKVTIALNTKQDKTEDIGSLQLDRLSELKAKADEVEEKGGQNNNEQKTDEEIKIEIINAANAYKNTKRGNKGRRNKREALEKLVEQYGNKGYTLKTDDGKGIIEVMLNGSTLVNCQRR